MVLYVMRHAPAVPRSVAVPDGERQLTSQGEADAMAVARGLKRLGVVCGAIRSSPFDRARQTAELVARELAPETALVVDAALLPGAKPGQVVKALKDVRTDVLVVGHDPHVSLLVALLLGAEGEALIDFSKGGVVALDCAGRLAKGQARLLWYLRRQQLALLGEAPEGPLDRPPDPSGQPFP